MLCVANEALLDSLTGMCDSRILDRLALSYWTIASDELLEDADAPVLGGFAIQVEAACLSASFFILSSNLLSFSLLSFNSISSALREVLRLDRANSGIASVPCSPLGDCLQYSDVGTYLLYLL